MDLLNLYSFANYTKHVCAPYLDGQNHKNRGTLLTIKLKVRIFHFKFIDKTLRVLVCSYNEIIAWTNMTNSIEQLILRLLTGHSFHWYSSWKILLLIELIKGYFCTFLRRLNLIDVQRRSGICSTLNQRFKLGMFI